MASEPEVERPGYPDVEKVNEDKYVVNIPFPAYSEDGRGEIHGGGVVGVHMSGDQLNEWVNKLSAELDGDARE